MSLFFQAPFLHDLLSTFWFPVAPLSIFLSENWGFTCPTLLYVSCECTLLQGPAAEHTKTKTNKQVVTSICPHSLGNHNSLHKRRIFLRVLGAYRPPQPVGKRMEKFERKYEKENGGISPTLSDLPTPNAQTRELLLELSLCPVPISEFQISLSSGRRYQGKKMINSFPFSEADKNVLQFQGEWKWTPPDVMALGPKYCYGFFGKKSVTAK